LPPHRVQRLRLGKRRAKAFDQFCRFHDDHPVGQFCGLDSDRDFEFFLRQTIFSQKVDALPGSRRLMGHTPLQHGISAWKSGTWAATRTLNTFPYAVSKKMCPSDAVKEVGSGMNGHRKGLMRLLRDPTAPTIVARRGQPGLHSRDRGGRNVRPVVWPLCRHARAAMSP
jgi:hypothetical protein